MTTDTTEKGLVSATNRTVAKYTELWTTTTVGQIR